MKKLKGAIFIAAVMILMVALLPSACGGGETTITATATTTATTTATVAKPEGTLTWGTASLQTEGFVPWIAFISDYIDYGPVYDYLVLETPEGEDVPCVATGWEWSNDYHDLTINIRQGIQFHNNWGELTAEDVAYLLDHMRSEQSTSGVTAFTAVIESVEVVGRYTLIVHQSEANVDYADQYAFSPPYCPILCKAYVESVGEEEANINPVGSGPYRLVEKRTGNYLKYEAVEDHWRVVPEFKYLIIKQVPEESSRIAMLKTGEIDACQVGPTSLPEVNAEADLTVETWPGGAISAIVFGGLCRPDHPLYQEGYHNQDPWADIRVREAMNIAIDRDAINQSLHYGTAMPAAVHLIMPGWEDLSAYPYDPDRARELLAEAAADGVFTPNAQGGFTFTLVSSPSHPGVPMIAKEAEAIAGYWADIGINAEINPIDFGAYWPKFNAMETAGECFTYRLLWGGTTNPFSDLIMLDRTAGWGFAYQCEASDIYTPMAQAALAEMDLTKREAMYREITQVIYDNYIVVPIMQVPYLIVKNNKVIGDWTPNTSSYYFNFEYARHAVPLNTFRLFELE
jgi:peptide/nickel transport system substrate-binding protein